MTVARRRATGVAIKIALIMEKKMTFMLLPIFLLFLHLYYNHNRNTRKEK
jgi:hypothetical protein